MRLKKRVVFVLIIFLILIIGVLFIRFVSSQKNKISGEVYEKLGESNEARVIINLKEPATEKGFLIKTQKTDKEIEAEKKEIKKEIINIVEQENVKHVFDESIAVAISENKLGELNENPDIESVTIDKPIHAFLQDSVPLINASTVWPIQLSGINITGIDETVCVLDTGINFSYADLAGKNKTCVIDCISKTCVENCSISDDNGHGTHVAGIVAASVRINGVAIGANLIGVKVLDSNGDGFGTDLNAGIDWCINNANTYNISVISMSLGDCSNHSTYCNSDSSASHINTAVGKNISVIVAAGNGPGGSCTGITNTNGPASPACVENATAVGAVSKSDTINYQRGALFELLAPGVGINSTIISNPQGDILTACGTGKSYCSLSGTSMATPHVAGAFALIRQFFRLQNNRVPTPSEIKILLNNTGIRINDSSGSGYNFSRIDVYSALISIDNSNPTVNLTSPANSTVQFNRNATFRCTANDVLLSNITLYVWNSTGVYNNTEVRQVSGTNTNQEFNLTNISFGNYKWNCLAYDRKGNFSFAGSNYSLTVGHAAVKLNSPLNNYFTNQNQTFNCSAETETTKQLTNITFYLWNSTQNLIFNLSRNISGTTNSTGFWYNFTQEGNYMWNCLAYDNAPESAFAVSNYTITYDVTKPNITLISPADLASYTSDSQQIIFQYNVSDNYNIANCSLIINDTINLINFSITNFSLTQVFGQTFSPASYSWQINCSDNATNQENSSQRSFIITAPQTQIQISGGGGSLSYAVYIPTTEQISQGYTKELKKDDKIKFVFFVKEEQHTLTVDHVGKNFVNLTVQSNVIKFALNVGGSVKLNLTSADYYDLYIKLNSIENSKANLTIKTIHEKIPIISITGEAVKKEEEKAEDKEIEKKEEGEEKEIKEKPLKIVNIISGILTIAILIIIVLIVLLKKTRKNLKTKRGKNETLKAKPQRKEKISSFRR